MKIRVALLLLVPVLLLLGGAACRIRMSEDPVIRVRDQEHGTVLASMPVKAGDDLVFEWIHSYEHIPWIEEYTVTEDLAFRLDAIRVAGFGAGIPNDKGETTVENGMVVMRNINETFPSFAWIHSETALVSITVGGKTLIEGGDLPHHKAVTLTLEGIQRLWTKSPSTI
ncbi:MAG TPA: DUF1850 domain-containing protein [Sphaerochaeta sp.]|nr:DUF1850 domain-containing protein [Sphaerochaeta sp.]